MNYKTIYYFYVQEEIEKGNKVYCLDREDKCVFCVNDLSMEKALGLLRKDNDNNNNRFEFWIEVKEK